MGEICQDTRERSLEYLEAEVSSRSSATETAADASAREHLAQCAECRAWVERARRLARALASLPRRSAPRELEERARLAARGDRRLGARGDVMAERAFASLGRVSAPHVLDRLVLEEIERPEQARARRFAGDLTRVPTPARLADRVEAHVERGESGDEPARQAPSTRRRFLWLGAAAAAAVLVSLGTWGAWRGGLLRTSGGRPSRFLVVEHRSASSLSPAAQSFLGGLAPEILATRPRAPLAEEGS